MKKLVLLICLSILFQNLSACFLEIKDMKITRCDNHETTDHAININTTMCTYKHKSFAQIIREEGPIVIARVQCILGNDLILTRFYSAKEFLDDICTRKNFWTRNCSFMKDKTNIPIITVDFFGIISAKDELAVYHPIKTNLFKAKWNKYFIKLGPKQFSICREKPFYILDDKPNLENNFFQSILDYTKAFLCICVETPNCITAECLNGCKRGFSGTNAAHNKFWKPITQIMKKDSPKQN